MAGGLIVALGLTGALMGSLKLDGGSGLVQAALTEQEVFVQALATSLCFTQMAPKEAGNGSPAEDQGQALIGFTIAQEVPRGYRVSVLFSGRYLDKAGQRVSAHAFEAENARGWEPSHTYETIISTDQLDEYYFQLGLVPLDQESGKPSYLTTFRESGFQVAASQIPYPNWETAYLHGVGGSVSQENPDDQGSFGLADLAGRGWPLLFRSTNGCEDSDVYSYTEGKLCYLGMIQGAPYQGDQGSAWAKNSPTQLLTLGAATEQGITTYSLTSGALIKVSDLVSQQAREKELRHQKAITYYPVNGEKREEIPLLMAYYGGFAGEGTQLMAANEWALSYVSRKGIIRYELLFGAKQAVFFAEDKTVVSDQSLFAEKRFISIRGSSPHAISYSLEATGPKNMTVTYLLAENSPVAKEIEDKS